jgi:hypothetical protein
VLMFQIDNLELDIQIRSSNAEIYGEA